VLGNGAQQRTDSDINLRGLLSARISVASAILALGVFVFCLSLTADGDWLVVWALIKPAEMAPALQPSLRRGYRVPGTPEGLGERQAFERQDGTTVIVEIVDYEPNRRAVTRQVSPTILEALRMVQIVEPVTGGCTYTEAVEVDLKARQRIRSEWERLWPSSAREQIDRIRASLESTPENS
jgi:hypothetical protein